VYRVLVVDDSAVIRGLISRAFDGQADLNVVGTAANGEMAVAALKKHPADIVILDIEMPVMDGLTAIPLLKEVDPGVQIIMASTLTQKNADISLRAMALGATDYIPKPSSDQMVGANAFNTELVDKVRALGALARRRGERLPSGVSAPPKLETVLAKKNISLRPMPTFKPDVIAIGSSTGGPQALYEVIKIMGKDLAMPIVITQHMPASFTKILAEHISRQCNVVCAEGKDDDVLEPGKYYLAPGDFHMTFAKKATGIVVRLNKEQPENFCRPAVDPMLRSLLEVYGKKILTVILTGMGQDGWKGGEAVVSAGGAVFAQDETTSVVWGMPGAVAMAGICSSVMPLDEIGRAVRALATGGRA
jgi:two-component system chemotaxis response regulator CheB